MHFEIFVEEFSAKKALTIIVPQIVGSDHTFQVFNFRSKQDLLRKLPERLCGYQSWIPSDWRVVVLVDEDRDDCVALKNQITMVAQRVGLEGRTLARIIVEELEAWFFGDPQALCDAYPRVPTSIGNKAAYRAPDAIRGGTWEALDRVLRTYGYSEGLIKTEAAERIATHMDPERNKSPSFEAFRDGLLSLIAESGPDP